jgi:nucleoside-diphosphate-sugar epimerase
MDAYMLAYDKGISGYYNVGTNRFGTLRQTLENLIKHANSTSNVKSLPTNLTINILKIADWLKISPLAPWHYLTYHKEFYFDVSPLINLGWDPTYSNDEMFRESYDWFIKNEDSINFKADGSAHRKPVKEALLKVLKWVS